jgi:hypothetical protein
MKSDNNVQTYNISLQVQGNQKVTERWRVSGLWIKFKLLVLAAYLLVDVPDSQTLFSSFMYAMLSSFYIPSI